MSQESMQRVALQWEKARLPCQDLSQAGRQLLHGTDCASDLRSGGQSQSLPASADLLSQDAAAAAAKPSAVCRAKTSSRAAWVQTLKPVSAEEAPAYWL